MTLNSFVKQLQKLQTAGFGRSKVVIDKPTFWDGNETFNICDVAQVNQNWVRCVDDDGFTVERCDGSEKTSSCVVLAGIMGGAK